MLDDLLELRDRRPDPVRRRGTPDRRAGGRRVAPDRRERPDQQGGRRRGAVGQLRGRRVRPLPGDAGRSGVLRGQARHRGPALPAHPLRADGRHQHDPALRHLGDRPRLRPAPVEPVAATTTSPVRSASSWPESWRWCPRGSCCSPASPSASPRSPWRAGRCWCRSCPRSRAWPGSTSCASTRRARSPRARSCSTSSRRSTVATTGTVQAALGALAADENRNATAVALAAEFDAPDRWTRGAAVPFSSARKWSAATFDGQGTLGHGRARDGAARRHRRRPARGPTRSPASGRRVLVLAHSDASLAGETLPAGLDAGRPGDVRREGPPRRRRHPRATSTSRA